MATNRFPGKTCVLCPNQSFGVGEHIWPRWLIGDFNGEGPFHTERAGEPYKKRDGVTVAEFNAVQGVHVPMCKRCNGILGRSIEIPAKPVVRKSMPIRPARAWPKLTADETSALARWFLKIALFLSHPDATNNSRHPSNDAAKTRLRDFQPEWVAWLRGEVDPPKEFTVYLTRRSARKEPTFQGERKVVILPGSLVVDGDEQAFMTRSVGIRGLQATIVWHPGWPILHPLVEAGRASKLWPNPTDVDLKRLPEVHPREFTFALDPSAVHLTAEQHSQLPRTPLQVGLIPGMVSFTQAR